MIITRNRRRVPRFARIRVMRRAPGEGVLVVEHEFEGGPFHGRRMTGLTSTVDMQVVRSEAGRKLRLVAHAGRQTCIGTYRFTRAYDCTRTLERVHVYRWCAPRASDAP